jgi:hypothetical protein
VSSPIFISYASIDQAVAETICDALQARGQPCWIACRDIGPGENFQEAIVRAIRSARVMLLVFTSSANNSDEIKKELVLAGRHRVTVLPIRVEDVVPNDAFAYEFATRQWIDLFKDWEREIDRLGTQIATIIASPKSGESADAPIATKPVPGFTAAQKSAPKSSSGPLVAVAVLVLAALGAGGLSLHAGWAGTGAPYNSGTRKFAAGQCTSQRAGPLACARSAHAGSCGCGNAAGRTTAITASATFDIGGGARLRRSLVDYVHVSGGRRRPWLLLSRRRANHRWDVARREGRKG